MSWRHMHVTSHLDGKSLARTAWQQETARLMPEIMRDPVASALRHLAEYAFAEFSKENAALRRAALTRDRLIAALRHPAVTGTLAMLEPQGGSPEDLADAIMEALDDSAEPKSPA